MIENKDMYPCLHQLHFAFPLTRDSQSFCLVNYEKLHCNIPAPKTDFSL